MLATSVVNLIVAIVNARSDGIRAGDRPADPVEVIVRRVGDGETVVEERGVCIGPDDPLSSSQIGARVRAALKRIAARGNRKKPRRRSKKQAARRR
jgi:hypothetical protein